MAGFKLVWREMSMNSSISWEASSTIKFLMVKLSLVLSFCLPMMWEKLDVQFMIFWVFLETQVVFKSCSFPLLEYSYFQCLNRAITWSSWRTSSLLSKSSRPWLLETKLDQAKCSLISRGLSLNIVIKSDYGLWITSAPGFAVAGVNRGPSWNSMNKVLRRSRQIWIWSKSLKTNSTILQQSEPHWSICNFMMLSHRVITLQSSLLMSFLWWSRVKQKSVDWPIHV